MARRTPGADPTGRLSSCVIGVDPGSSRTGVGIVTQQGTRYRLVHQEVIRAAGNLPDRLVRIRGRLAEIVDRFAPREAAVEDVFHARNVASVVKLAQARGVALVTLAEAGLPVTSYPPAVVKRAVTGSGRAEKPQVARMTGAILGLPEPPLGDAADALAVALCHAMHPRSGVTP
jgi:crossover junction endodeoxyribonuclease RuvC